MDIICKASSTSTWSTLQTTKDACTELFSIYLEITQATIIAMLKKYWLNVSSFQELYKILNRIDWMTHTIEQLQVFDKVSICTFFGVLFFKVVGHSDDCCILIFWLGSRYFCIFIGKMCGAIQSSYFSLTCILFVWKWQDIYLKQQHLQAHFNLYFRACCKDLTTLDVQLPYSDSNCLLYIYGPTTSHSCIRIFSPTLISNPRALSTHSSRRVS